MRLVYVAPVPWESYEQRPQFMVRALLSCGVEHVLWLNPYPARLPRASDLRRRRPAAPPATVADARVRIVDVPALPLEPLASGRWLNRRLWHDVRRQVRDFVADAADPRQACLVLGRPCQLALTLAQDCPQVPSCYDAMDDFPEFYTGLSRRALARVEQALADNADRILVSSTQLGRKFSAHAAKLRHVPNAYPMQHLSAQRVAPAGEPVLGYLGTIGPWFDWDTVAALARAMPTCALELVGPCLVPPPPELSGRVRLFPACRQDEAAGHLARFSAGLIPFRVTPLTESVDPVKYYEYRAAGLPVLSTSFGEMHRRGRADHVHAIDAAQGDAPLAAQVQRAIAQPPNAAETARFRREHDWSCRFDAELWSWMRTHGTARHGRQLRSAA